MIILTKEERNLRRYFVNFLVTNNALQNYNAEFIKENRNFAQSYFARMFKNKLIKPKDFLSASFLFFKTEKGYDYWHNLNSKWEKECNFK